MRITKAQRIGIAGAFLFIFSVSILFGVFPAVLMANVKESLCLHQETMIRNFWGRTPFSFEARIYIFNVTNPEGIHRGEKPVVKEVGPFVYDEWTEKTNLVDDEKDDTVSYNSKKTYYFNEEKSGGLNHDVELMMPNHFALAMFNAVMREQEGALPIVEKAVDSMYHFPETMFRKTRVGDILFDGVLIDCTAPGFSALMVCMDLQENHKKYPIKMVDSTTYSISLFGKVNGTDSRARTKVKRGIVNVMDVGTVVEYNNKPNISTWDDKYCDAFRGTDGTIIHPLLSSKGKDDIVIFVPDFCRSVSCHFDHKIKYWGIKLLRYTADVGTDGISNPKETCYCVTPKRCPKKGVFDAFKCAHTPIFFTNPHFYNTDPHYLKLVDGLHPNKENHSVILDIDAITGIPVRAYKRVQINMFLLKLNSTRLMANMNNALLPLVWMEEVIILPEFLMKGLSLGLYLKSKLILVMYALMLGGIGMMGYTGFEQYRTMKNGNKLIDSKTGTASNGTPKKTDVVSISTVQRSATTKKSDANNNNNNNNNVIQTSETPSKVN